MRRAAHISNNILLVVLIQNRGSGITATHCNTLQHKITHCNTIQHTGTNCNTPQHTATHCNTLQHTATHCNTLQHTAAHCDTYCTAKQVWFRGAGVQTSLQVRAQHVAVHELSHSHPRETPGVPYHSAILSHTKRYLPHMNESRHTHKSDSWIVLFTSARHPTCVLRVSFISHYWCT